MAKPADASKNMNYSALKLADPYVKDILDTAAHVALYNFQSETREWEKTNVEGALFLYSRSVEPKFNVFVMNRLSMTNLIEPIDEGMDLQLQEPFLLYRNSKSEVHGVWFYNKDECVRIHGAIERLVNEVGAGRGPGRSANPPVTPSSQMDQKSISSPSQSQGVATNQRVIDFFAKAGGGKVPLLMSPRPPPPGMQRQEKAEVPNCNPLLQRLMSNPPVHTLEEIEKKQGFASIARTEERPSSLGISPGARVDGGNPSRQSLTNGVYNLRISSSGNVVESPSKFAPTKATPAQASSISTQHFFNSSLVSQPSARVSDSPLEVSVLERSVMETPTKPALIPPVMFTTPREDKLQLPSDPLTKSQLLQAVSYLLKNDADFVDKLHEAYVKSFVESVS